MHEILYIVCILPVALALGLMMIGAAAHLIERVGISPSAAQIVVPILILVSGFVMSFVSKLFYDVIGSLLA